VLLAVSLCSFMVALDTTALNVALPAIGRAFTVGMAWLQWIAGAYTLVFAGLLLSAGALCDRFGARPVFLLALLLFTLSSLACGLAGGVPSLIAARALQGAGAALMLPGSMALLACAYPESAARAKAVALWGGISALALVAGPVLGGAVVEWVGWRAIFFLNLPCCLAALAGAWRAASPPAAKDRKPDWPGQLLAFPALLLLTFVLIEGNTLRWASPLTLSLLAGGLLLAGLFIASQRRSAHPMLPLTLFASAPFSAAIGTGFLQTLGYYGSLFLLPLVLQRHGLAPLTIGLCMLPMTLSTGLLATFSGRLSRRFGARQIGVTGMLSGAMGALLLTVTGFTPAGLAAGGLLLGLGGATLPVIVAACLAAVPPERIGIGSGVLNAARQCGGLCGIALLGSLLQQPGLERPALGVVVSAFALAALLTRRRLYAATALPVAGR
jgi:DHA2 family methylenomycin A resistance protein-like MFS transporter